MSSWEEIRERKGRDLDRPDVVRRMITSGGGVKLAVWDWPAEGTAAATVVIVHATGYHGRCYDSVVARLDRTVRCVCVDLRGHGWSDKPTPSSIGWTEAWSAQGKDYGYYPYPQFGSDVQEVVRALDIQGAIGVGHSMGGAALMHAAVEDASLFSGIVLVDPIVLRPDRYGIPADGGTESSQGASKRKADFESPKAMFERFKGRYPFTLWTKAALADYCEYGLLPKDGDDSKNGYTLACPPTLEAATFAGSTSPEADLHGKLLEVAVPTHILRAGTDHEEEDMKKGMWHFSPTDPNLRKEFGASHLVSDFATGMSHFMPFENPEFVAGHVEQVLKEVSAGAPFTQQHARL